MSTEPAVTTVKDGTLEKTGHSTPARQVPGLAVYTGILILTQHVWIEHASTQKWPWGAMVLLILAVAGGLFMLVRAWNGLLERLGSVGFSVAILSFLAVATAMGTMTPQETPQPGQVPVGLGENVAGLLFLHDFFHSVWYGGLLALLTASLLLTVMQRPFWKAYYWGFLLGHLGLVVVLVGGALGRWYGETGQMSLHVGQVTDDFLQLERGVPTGKKRLDFALRLDSFDVQKYPSKDPIRLSVFRLAGHQENPRPIYSTPVKVGGEYSVPSINVKFRVREIYPEIEITETMEATESTTMPPAAEVQLKEGTQETRYWLVGGFSPHMAMHASGLDVEWGDLSDATWPARTQQGKPARHLISLPGSTEPIEVRVGTTYKVPGGKQQFSVTAFFPEFSYDIESRKAYSLSDEPKNPALQVEITGEDGKGNTQYLFPGEGAHMDKGNPLDLNYRFEAGETQIAHLIRLDGTKGLLGYATAGREVFQKPFEAGKTVEIPLEVEPQGSPRTVQFTVLNLFAHARPKLTMRTLSEQPRNPGVVVEVQREGHEEMAVEALLTMEEQALDLGRDLMLVMEVREEEVKKYESHVSVMRGDQVVSTAVIAVNDPLTIDGYSFYQSDYRREEPDYSGLRVAKDPGLGIAFAGMILASLGVTYTLYVRPRLRKEGTDGKDAA